MKPTIGRIVIFSLSDGEEPVNGSYEHPAVVTAVHGDGETPDLNLCVFLDQHTPLPFRSVKHHLNPDAVNSRTWRWPERAAS